MTKSAHEVFLEFLKRKGLNMTPQRAVIVEAFIDTEGHFSCEDLTNTIREVNPGIGLATVYRTLKLLVDSGLADSFDIGDGVALYEHAYGHSHHDHLICTACNKKVEVIDNEIERRQQLLAEEKGFTLKRHRMFLYGLCPKCKGKKGEWAKPDLAIPSFKGERS